MQDKDDWDEFVQLLTYAYSFLNSPLEKHASVQSISEQETSPNGRRKALIGNPVPNDANKTTPATMFKERPLKRLIRMKVKMNSFAEMAQERCKNYLDEPVRAASKYSTVDYFFVDVSLDTHQKQTSSTKKR